MNSTHVIVVDYGYCSLQLVNRKDKSNRVIAGSRGSCTTSNGNPGRLYNPWSIEQDLRKPEMFYVTDYSTYHLRSFNFQSRYLTTIVTSGFSYPRGLSWYNNNLIVSNYAYISQVSWSVNGAVKNTRITSGSSGTMNGEFAKARFGNVYEITSLHDSLYLAADDNNILRLLDMNGKNVLPVCIGPTASCNTSTSLSYDPYTIAATKDGVYVGMSRKIIKLSGRLVFNLLCSQ